MTLPTSCARVVRVHTAGADVALQQRDHIVDERGVVQEGVSVKVLLTVHV